MFVRALFAALLVAAATRADSIADEADFRFHRGTTLYRKGHVEEALSEFLASNRLVRNRNVIFNIARSFEQLGMYNEAYRWYGEIQQEMPEVEEALRRLSPSLALLRIESAPGGATVYIGRKDLGARGQTPLTLALPPGKAAVILELPGHHALQAEAALVVGKTVQLRPALEPIYGELEVAGEPSGSRIRLDQTGALALDARGRAKVTAGPHVLTISAPGHADEQIPVEVPADSVRPVSFKLLPLPPPAGALIVRANLDGALVRVDGKEAGFTPGVIDNVVAGPHQVEVVAEGREPVVRTVEVRKDERSYLDVKLRYTTPRVVAAEKALTGAQDAPASVTVITADEIRGFGYTTLAEALQSVRGFYTTYDRDYATLGVRGFGSPGVYNSRVLVLSDGHVTNESSLGQGYVGHDFDADLSDVERIEVVRGPGSVTYGSAAFFAVVNVVHRTPPTGMHGEVGGIAGTLGENSAHAILSAAGESSYAWVRASGLSMAGESFFAHPADPARVAVNLDSERAGHLDLRARSGDLLLLASYNDRRKDLPTGAYDTVFGAPGTSTRDRRGFFEAQLAHAFDSGLLFEARAAYDGERYKGYWQYNGRALGTLGSDLSAEDWVSGELRLRLPEVSGHRVFVGGEIQDRWKVNLNAVVPADVNGQGATHWSNYDDGLGPADQVPNSELVLSAYGGDDWRIADRIQLDAAVRVDVFRDDFPAGSTDTNPAPVVNPRLALLLHPYDAGHSKVLFGRAFRYPGFYERYYNDGAVSQVRAANLQPESVYTGEIEHAHQFSDEVTLTVAAYLSEMQHLIALGTAAGRPDLLQYQNSLHPVHAAGGEIELRWQAGPSWLFSAWYAYSIVREDPGAWFAGTPLPNSPESTGALRVLYPVVPQSLALATELMYGGPRRSIADPSGSVALLGETLSWNLGVSGEYPRWGLRYGAFVNNVLDQKVLLPAGPEIAFPNHAIPQYGRTLRISGSASF